MEENCLSLYSDTSMLPTSWNLPLWRLCCQAFMQRKEIVNFQNSSIDLQGSRIESNLVMCGFRQREVSPHCLCLQEKCTRRCPPLLSPVNNGTGETFLSLTALRQVCKYLSYPHCKLRNRYLLLQKVMKNS